MEFTHLFFDLDGTLTDPAEGITNSYRYALIQMGLEVPSYEELCTYIGPPLKDNFRDNYSLNEEQLNIAVKEYRSYFAEKGLFENKVYDGIPEMLGALKASGRKLIVATSKPEVFSIRILEKFNLAQYFDFICGSNLDETRSKKEEVIEYALAQCKNPPVSKVLMIGDRKFDVEGAHKNHIKCCSVLYGYGNREEFKAAGSDFIVDTVSDLLSFINKH